VRGNLVWGGAERQREVVGPCRRVKLMKRGVTEYCTHLSDIPAFVDVPEIEVVIAYSSFPIS
jgi:hypothetical protein